MTNPTIQAKTEDGKPLLLKFVRLPEPEWDDMRVPMTSVKAAGVRDPDFIQFRDDGGGSTGVFSWAFIGTGALIEELFFSAQIPHGYVEGTDLEAHVHWSPSTAAAGNVVWQLEYTVADEIAGVFGTTTLLVAPAVSTESTQYKHIRSELGQIPGTGLGISSIIIGRIFRDPANGSDTYGADAFLLEVDFHFLNNTIGSTTEEVK